MPPTASPLVFAMMAALPVVVAFALIFGIGHAGGRRAAFNAAVGLGIWMGITAALARIGVLAHFDARPPPLALLVVVALVGAIWAAYGVVGRQVAGALPIAALVGLHAFRLPLELVMHRAATEGVMPVQMSFGGWNFDIVTGATAVLVAALAAFGRAPKWLVFSWNVLGFVTLVTVMTIGISSLPMLHAFGKEPARVNTWIAFFPYVWLVTVLVPTALTGHLVLLRRLLSKAD